MIVAILLAAALVGLLVVPPGRSVEVVTDEGTRRANALSSAPDSGMQDDPQIADSPVTAVPPSAAAPETDAAAAAPKTSPSGQRASTSTITPTAPHPAAPATVRQTIDTGLWISDGAAPLRPIAAESGWKPLAWSPESNSVAVARGGDVLVFDAGTGGRRPLISRPGLIALRGAWSPDGRSLAVQFTGVPSPTLYVVDVATGGTTEIPMHNLMSNLAYTPTGCLAFGDSFDGETGIALYCPSEPRRMLPLPSSMLVAALGNVGLAYTADGPSGISAVGFDGRALPGVTGISNLYGDDGLVWDQAGGLIIWRGSNHSGEGRVALYASVPGGTTTIVSPCSASTPTASTTGILAYAECSGSRPANLLRRSSPSAQPQAVATIPDYRTLTPFISPNGRWLLVAVSPA